MSLATRLSLFFLAALAAVLVGFSVGLSLLAAGYLDRRATERLDAAMVALVASCEVEDGGVEWEPRDHRLDLGFEPEPDRVRWTVRDAAGRLIDRSANLGPTGPIAEGSPVPLDGQIRRLDHDGRRWLVVARRLEPPPADGEAGQSLILAACLSLEPAGRTLRHLERSLAAISLALWITFAALGRRICRRALAPLSRMAAEARAMDATRPDAALDVAPTGDELEDLGRSFNGLLGRLGEALERQRGFTGDASHQLRTPLTAMIGEVTLTLRRERSTAEYREALGKVQAQATRLAGIVESLLFLARAEHDARVPDRRPIDLSAWLDEQRGRWSDHPREPDLTWRIAEADPLVVVGQPELLAQLLDNLIDNACKYSNPGTPVEIEAGPDGDGVALAVLDRGVGIDPAEAGRLFDPFFRSATARRSGHAGVGLGLAVAGRIAGALGLDLRAEPRSGGGSRFVLRFPRSATADQSEPCSLTTLL